MPILRDERGESLVDRSDWPQQTTMIDPREGMRIGVPAEVALTLREALMDAGVYQQDVVRALPSKDGMKEVYVVDLWHRLYEGVTYGRPGKSLINRRKEIFDRVVNGRATNSTMLTTARMAGEPHPVKCSSCGEWQSLGTVLRGSPGKWLCHKCAGETALVKRARGRPKKHR